MPALRTCAVVLLLLVAAPLPAAAPPRPFPLARWLEDLASDDDATWRRASDQLWKAGRAAEPALRAAQKHSDPDVVLRARLILARFEWGIFPDVPPAIVRLLERYRDGDQAQRRTVVEEMIKKGKPGYVALQRALVHETDAGLRKYAADYLKREYRALLRDLLLADDHKGATDLLEVIAEGGNAEPMRDLAVVLVLTGQAAARARQLEQRAARGDPGAATRGVFLYRAAGDLAGARRLVAKAESNRLLVNILEEQEDFKALLAQWPMVEAPAVRAAVRYLAGDHAGRDAEVKRLAGREASARSHVLFFCGLPRRAIDAQQQAGSLASACELLALQGRRREALALDGERAIPKDITGRVGLLVEQAVLAHRMGEKERADKFLAGALALAEKASSYHDHTLSSVLGGGIRMNRRTEVAAAVGKVLDRLRPTPPIRSLFYVLSPRDSDVLELWWDYLRRKYLDTLPSATLARMRGWFEDGKPDREFDDLVADVERQALPAEQQDRWRAALARTCVVVGKEKKAEELLRTAAQVAKSAPAYQRLGDFYFERKRWREAAAEYARAAERDRGNALALYLRGLALTRLGQPREGQALIARARLLPLASEQERYNLARGLGRHGLRDEAEAEWLLLLRSSEFNSVYATNAAGALLPRAAREKRPGESARLYRRIVLNMVIGGGGFLDGKAYLMVPARAHLYQARALLAEGKLDAARAEVEQVLEHLPEEIGVVIDLVRALDRAKRGPDADRLFAAVFARRCQACAEAPRSAHLHNQLAWLAVRCGRQLAVALRHAQAAATREPKAPGYLDTLAEAHFQRGDRAAALAVMKLVLKLAPGDAYFLAQQRRIEAGDPAAELPRR